MINIMIHEGYRGNCHIYDKSTATEMFSSIFLTGEVLFQDLAGNNENSADYNR